MPVHLDGESRGFSVEFLAFSSKVTRNKNIPGDDSEQWKSLRFLSLQLVSQSGDLDTLPDQVETHDLQQDG